MKLYHGSNQEIIRIDLLKCRPFKDFGRGFYLTNIRTQAEKMAQRVARIYGGTPAVSCFELDADTFADPGLSIRTFAEPSEEWAAFVMNNRALKLHDPKDQNHNRDLRYDIVIGPVANDDLALLFRQFEAGLIDTQILVREMRYKRLTNQYSFHTERVIERLKKVTDDE